jgi:hypothetical protein
VARILAHRRDEHPISKFYFSNRERIKQASHGQRSEVRSRKWEVMGQRSVIRMRRMSKVQFVRTAVSAAAQIAGRLRGLGYRKASSVTRPLDSLYCISNEGAPITSTVALKNPPPPQ